MEFVITIATFFKRLRDAVAETFRLWNARIDGVEVTQSIQYFQSARHLTDANDRAPDNDVQLIAGKAAWVRVYVRPGIRLIGPNVTGTLKVERRNLGVFWQQVALLSPQPPGNVTASQIISYATERGSVANTLNFVIPSADFGGHMQLTITLQSASGAVHDTKAMIVRANLRQTLRLRGIFVSYSGPSTSSPAPGTTAPTINLAAPTLANLQATAALSMRAMPVNSTGLFTSAGTMPFSQPLDDPRTGAGGCSVNWGTLLTQLGNRRLNDGNVGTVVYYGLLPAAMPLNVPGCGVGGLGGGATGDQTTLMHEIGHGYGFQHTPCGPAGATDPNYPTYEPYPSASIGEYGLDIANGNVLPPNGVSDYMSYCPPRWMSLYHHRLLIGHTRLDPQWLLEEPIWKDYLPIEKQLIPELWLPDPPPYRPPTTDEAERMHRVIAISGIVHGEKEIEVTTVARISAAGLPPGAGTKLTAQLVDGQGRTIARGALFQLTPHGGCGGEGDCGGDGLGKPPYAFQAFVADVAPGAALTITGEDGSEAWSRRAPDRTPEVRAFDAAVADGELALRWDADTASGDAEAWLQWSDDEGRSWRGLATGLGGGEARVPLAGLPGASVFLRLLVHDGFSTAASPLVLVTLPALPPEASILHPSEGQLLPAGGTMQLFAAASDTAGEPLPDESCRWLLDGSDAGRGKEVWIATPAPGEHRVTLIARGPGGQTERTATFRTYRGRYSDR